MKACALNNLSCYYTEKMSPRKLEKNVMIKFRKS